MNTPLCSRMYATGLSAAPPSTLEAGADDTSAYADRKTAPAVAKPDRVNIQPMAWCACRDTIRAPTAAKANAPRNATPIVHASSVDKGVCSGRENKKTEIGMNATVSPKPSHAIDRARRALIVWSRQARSGPRDSRYAT